MGGIHVSVHSTTLNTLQTGTTPNLRAACLLTAVIVLYYMSTKEPDA